MSGGLRRSFVFVVLLSFLFPLSSHCSPTLTRSTYLNDLRILGGRVLVTSQ
jgi:hypothetical protein